MHSCEVAETGHLFEQRERLTGQKTKGQGGFFALGRGKKRDSEDIREG